jgi:hypothetical protein
MVVLIIVPHAYRTGGDSRYVGGTVDRALPANFWSHPNAQEYIIGVVKDPCWFVHLAADLEDNKNHFVIIGTSAPSSRAFSIGAGNNLSVTGNIHPVR